MYITVAQSQWCACVPLWIGGAQRIADLRHRYFNIPRTVPKTAQVCLNLVRLSHKDSLSGRSHVLEKTNVPCTADATICEEPYLVAD